MTIESQDLLCDPNNLGFEDLGIKPVSFGHKAHHLVAEITWMWNARDVSKRDTANSWTHSTLFAYLFKHINPKNFAHNQTYIIQKLLLYLVIININLDIWIKGGLVIGFALMLWNLTYLFVKFFSETTWSLDFINLIIETFLRNFQFWVIILFSVI